MSMFSLSQIRLHRQLDSLAGTGDFDIDILHSIRSQCGAKVSHSLRYYLASLYLQRGDMSSTDALLGNQKSASREMKKFCHVLIYSRQRGYSVPPLSEDERGCLNYLENVLKPMTLSFARVISQHEGILVCGNAPGDNLIECPDSWCKIVFNDYPKNPRIKDTATIHVVTPSWQQLPVRESEYLCITGNDIFYRRSSVWKRFLYHQYFKAVFTVPGTLWKDLYQRLSCPPSAGLLMLSYLESLVRQGEIAANMPFMVAGFSSNQSGVNHTYDSIPASNRHNWTAERVVYDGLLNELENRCTNFVVQK